MIDGGCSLSRESMFTYPPTAVGVFVTDVSRNHRVRAGSGA